MKNKLDTICDSLVTQLRVVIMEVEAIRTSGYKNRDAIASLSQKCWNLSYPYTGDVFCVNMEDLFMELEALEADEVFGPREMKEEVL